MPKAACLTCTALSRLDLCACIGIYLCAAFYVEVIVFIIFVILGVPILKKLLCRKGRVFAAGLADSHGAVIAWSAIDLNFFFSLKSTSNVV